MSYLCFLLTLFLTHSWLVWDNIRPKLIPLIEADRTVRLEKEEQERKHDRTNTLDRLFADIKDTDPPLIDTQIMHPCHRPSSSFGGSITTVTHRRLFPELPDLLELPIIKSLDETDVSAAEMEARFQEHRQDIIAFISARAPRVEENMASVLRQGRLREGLPEAAPGPILPILRSNPDTFINISDDMKLLLRADSLFEPVGKSAKHPMSYDSIIMASSFSYSYMRRDCPLDTTIFSPHVEGQKFARAFLKQLGRPDTCFLGFEPAETQFSCRSWGEIVRNFLVLRSHFIPD